MVNNILDINSTSGKEERKEKNELGGEERENRGEEERGLGRERGRRV